MDVEFWAGELERLGVAQGVELGVQRAVLTRWLAAIAGRSGVGRISLYGSLAVGGDCFSDIDLVVEAEPGSWAALWATRSDLLEPRAAVPDLRLEHQWGPTTDEVCYAGLSEEGVYLDLVLRRHGGPLKVGEVAIWQRGAGDGLVASSTLPTIASPAAREECPVVTVDPFEDRAKLALFGAVLCARSIARGAVWHALELLAGERDLFLALWRLAQHDEDRVEHGWTPRVDSELPLDARERLSRAVPHLSRPELATALWEVVDLLELYVPGLAASLGKRYPSDGAAFVRRIIADVLAGVGLPAESPTRLVPAVGRQAAVSLREINSDNVRAICRLDVAPDQRHVVAPNARSLAQAMFAGGRAWFRAIYADETPVGFVMLYDHPEQADYFLWRLMIDARYQQLGYGRRAVQLLIEHVRTRPGAKVLGVTYHKGPGGPEAFYRKLGFVETGEMDGDEYIARLPL